MSPWNLACGQDLGDVMPIMAWDYTDDPAVLKKMADCGVNMVAFVPTKALDACQQHGIKAIVYEPGMTPARWDQPFKAAESIGVITKTIEQVNDHPAVFGYHLKDEPGADQFAELGKASEVVRKLAPGKWPYINMTPGMGEGYDGFLEMYIEACKPTILSYDNYPVGQEGNFSYGYWANIVAIRKAALKHNLPFWTIFLSSAHLGYGEPTEGALRLQAYGALAYGARGLCYYKFQSRALPILEAPDLGDFRNGPLDQFGEKTPAWHWVRNMNRQIQNIAPTLLKLTSTSVYHIGEVPEDNQGPSEESLITGFDGGIGFIVGEFTHKDGSRWVMVVNKSTTHSYPCRPTYRNKPAKVEYIYPVTGELREFPAPWYFLPPGQGVLLKLTPEPAAASPDAPAR